jgi:energy-converting hydrogenase Eha subunit A
MLTTNLKQLSAVGWLLAAAALIATVLVSIPLGAWALDAIDRSAFRSWRDPIIYLLAVPALGAAIITFWAGERLLRRLGIDVQRHGSVGAQHS